MAKVRALAVTVASSAALDHLRALIVAGCAIALVLAGQSLPL